MKLKVHLDLINIVSGQKKQKTSPWSAFIFVNHKSPFSSQSLNNQWYEPPGKIESFFSVDTDSGVNDLALSRSLLFVLPADAEQLRPIPTQVAGKVISTAAAI